MLTYQDLLEQTSEKQKQEFLLRAINEYKGSDEYKWAIDAHAYNNKINTTIMKYQKFVFKETGQKVVDLFSANHKIVSNFFGRFVTQETQYLLGNGSNWEKEDTRDRLGTKRIPFDNQLQKLAKKALICGRAYGFWNLDHLDIFDATEFVPLWDEEDGSLKAGIRFWQLADDKPLRLTLYEIDGYTEYIKRKKGNNLEVIGNPKQTYIKIASESIADGVEINDGRNYPSFPICVLWGNESHQSELVGIKSQIDAYDLIKSGMANDLDEANFIYWIIENAGGMDEEDLIRFRDRIKTTKTALLDDDGAKAHAETMEVPSASRETYLKMLKSDLYDDAMALNVRDISSGNVTATAINASYEPLNNKCDEFEYCVLDFIQSLLDIVGIEDTPSFKRSKIVNQTEETNMILASAQYLDTETILQKLPFLTVDEVQGILDRLTEEEADRYGEGEETNVYGQTAEEDGEED